jgi:hypothetical protein
VPQSTFHRLRSRAAAPLFSIRCCRLRTHCSHTGMFALPNPIFTLSSAAFARARLRSGSPSVRSAQVCSGLLTPITRTRRSRDYRHQKSSTFNEGSEEGPSKYVTTIYSQLTDKHGNSNSGSYFPCPHLSRALVQAENLN